MLEYQPQPLSAMQMIAGEPVRVVNGRKAVCDGGAFVLDFKEIFYVYENLFVSLTVLSLGAGPLGHPKVFINLDKPGPHPCGYVYASYSKLATSFWSTDWFSIRTCFNSNRVADIGTSISFPLRILTLG